VSAFVDAYAVLGVEADASQAALKAAHRRLVRLHHPDLVPPQARAEATRRVQDINVAYGLVRDPAARARYDAVRRNAQRGAQWDELVTAAGRWAGRWWRRNRVPLRRAGQRTRRGALDVVGRVLWLASSAAGVVVGWLLAVAAQHVLGVDGVVAPAVGALGGALVGSQRGWHRRLRLAGLASPRAYAVRSGTAAWVGALALALVADARL
jgi:hypothetical protein